MEALSINFLSTNTVWRVILVAANFRTNDPLYILNIRTARIVKLNLNNFFSYDALQYETYENNLLYSN